MSPPGIDCERAIGMLNVARSKYTILREGKLLPVTNLFDSDGNEVHHAPDAFRCVVFDAGRPGDQWAVYELTPGEIL